MLWKNCHKELVHPRAYRCIKPSTRQDTITIGISGEKHDIKQHPSTYAPALIIQASKDTHYISC